MSQNFGVKGRERGYLAGNLCKKKKVRKRSLVQENTLSFKKKIVQENKNSLKKTRS